MKRILNLIIAFGALLIGSCAPEPVRVSSVTLNSKAITLEVGKSETLTATVSPYNADNSTIIWASDNASIAKVSGGTVTAISPGTARITAKADDGGVYDACVVTVPEPFISVTGISLDQESVILKESEWYELHATVSPSNATDPSLQWSSSDVKIIQVTSEGVLLALKPGTAVITVTTVDGGIKASCKVTVKDKVTGLTLEPPKMDIVVGEEAVIIARLEPEDSDVNVFWQSVDPDIVSVDGNGHITALAPGDAVICAATDFKGLQAFCKIHVRNKVESLKLTVPSSEAFIGGDPLQLSATITPAGLPGIKVIWESSDSSILKVDGEGLATAKKKGKATVTVTVENGSQRVSESREIQVIQPVTSIKVSPSSLEMFVDEVIDMESVFSVTVGPEDADDKSWKNTLSNATKVSVSDGKITGLSAGDVTLSFKPNKGFPKDLKAECKITVKAKVASVTLSASTKSLQVGQTYSLTAKVSPSNANQEVTWSSSDEKIVSVTNGKITALKVGEADITAASKENPDINATCRVTVVNIPVESVELSKAELTLVEGETGILTATVKPDNAFDKNVEWTSSDESVATVSDGKIVAVKAGVTTITATCGGKSATCNVTVNPKVIPVTGVSLDKDELTLDVGASSQLTASVLPSNASNKALTWRSTNPSVVSISYQGNVATLSAKDAGEATIVVETTEGGFKAECKVKVNAVVTSITLPTTSVTIEFGKTYDLSDVTILPADAADKTLEWSSSNTTIATVTAGIVKAGKTEGTTTITVKSKANPQVSASCKVTVKSKIILVTSITITPSRLDLYVNQTKQVKVEISPSNAENKGYKFSLPQGGLVTVDKNGNVKGIRTGTTRLMVTSDDGNAQAMIPIYITKNSIAEVSVTPASLVMKIGETYVLKEKVTGEDSSAPASRPEVTWESSNPSVATVDSNTGKVTAVSAGTTTVTVICTDDRSKTAECEVTVLATDTSNGGTEGFNFENWNF